MPKPTHWAHREALPSGHEGARAGDPSGPLQQPCGASRSAGAAGGWAAQQQLWRAAEAIWCRTGAGSREDARCEAIAGQNASQAASNSQDDAHRLGTGRYKAAIPRRWAMAGFIARERF